jgi:Flp pilus assembly protein TadG
MKSLHNRRQRAGTIIVLMAIMMVVLFAMLAFAMDIGYLGVSKTQLQAAADSAALAAAATTNQSRSEMEAVAQQFAAANIVAGRPVQLNANDIVYGLWDTDTRVFTPSSTPGNAVKVTVRADASSGGSVGLFFGKVLGLSSVSQQASAIATSNPRDIAFVVDLSGTMNNDTEPGNTASLNSTYAPQGYPTIGTDIMQKVYDDFGFGAYAEPGNQEWAGYPLLSSGSTNWVSNLTQSGGPLRNTSIPTRYRVLSTDSSSTKTWKAYAWVMEIQIPKSTLMPAATPAPNADANYAYWKSFIDTYPTKLGYRNYVQFMMDNGREQKPGGTSYTPLSLLSGITLMHNEATAGGTFGMPPREQPTHAARRALIAAIQVVKERNQTISDPNQRDWVSIITFDKPNAVTPISPRVEQALTSNYSDAMTACTRLQACSDSSNNTCTESGLTLARDHIKPADEGGSGRKSSNKIVVLLTDGIPNLYTSSSSTISIYRNDHPSPNYYGGSSKYPHDAALMQTASMQGANWFIYPVGVGLGCDYDFMDRMARMGATANSSGQSARGTGSPAEYEAVLTDIFNKIITNPKLRIVK